MAIGDHAISDRAISAPEDSVVVGVTLCGKVFVKDGPSTFAQVFDSHAGFVGVADEPSAGAEAGDLAAFRAYLSDGPSAVAVAGNGLP